MTSKHKKTSKKGKVIFSKTLSKKLTAKLYDIEASYKKQAKLYAKSYECQYDTPKNRLAQIKLTSKADEQYTKTKIKQAEFVVMGGPSIWESF